MLLIQKKESFCSAESLMFALGMLMMLFCVSNPVYAAPLDLTLQATPGIFSDFIDVNYNASNQSFTAHGFVEQIMSDAGVPTPIVNGTFEITAIVTSAGSAVGTLIINGEVPALGIKPGTLLVGDVSALGSGVAGGALEFQCSTNGGALAFKFGPQIGIILSQSGFAGDFTQSFSSNSIAVAGIGW